MPDPHRPHGSTVPTVLSACAFAVAAFVLVRSLTEAEPTRPPEPAVIERVVASDPLVRSVPEARVAATQRSGVADPDAGERRVVLENAFGELVQRIERLESRLGAVEIALRRREAGAAPERVQRSAAEVAAERIALVERARTTIVDPRASEADKLRAWGQLRGAGPDAWTPEVVAEMARIGLTSSDAAVRADVWRQASAPRARSDALVPPLLQALADAEARVRSEAAETLGRYREHGLVVQALEATAANDPDDDVRRQARRSLGDR